MTKEMLPHKIDPFRSADTSSHLHGIFLLNQLVRLNPSLYSNEGEVEVDLQFQVDEQHIRHLKGFIKTNLTLQCQRCLEPFLYEIKNELVMGIVHTEEEAHTLPSYYDPLVVSENFISIPDLVEDELIISLPIVPMHEGSECKIKTPIVSITEGIDQADDNPFKVVELLRKDRNQNQ